MSWWPWSEQKGEAAVSRSTMRNSMSKLRAILIRCGLPDDGDKDAAASTGDPFTDKVSMFVRSCKQLEEQIRERNKAVLEAVGGAADIAGDSSDINRRKRELKDELAEIKALAEESEAKVRKANKKQKAKEIIDQLEATHKTRESMHQNCKTAYDRICDIDAQRGMSEKDIAMNQQGTGTGGVYRQSLTALRNRNKRKDGRINLGANDPNSGNLDTNAETAEEMKKLRSQQQQMDAGLDQLNVILQNITSGARQLGDELKKQTQMIEESSGTIDRLTNNLVQLNKGITSVIKAQGPMSVMLYAVGCFMILGIVGFMLVQLNVL
jgi:peptidoglycan hydrolase CwlO-like protein